MGSGSGALWVFGGYLVVVFALAWAAERMRGGSGFVSEYFLGSRNLGMWAFALTFAATTASGGTFIGFPALVYANGWSVALWIASYMMVPLVAMGLMGKRINRVARLSGAVTVPELLEERFKNRGVGVAATGMVVFFMFFYLLAQFKAGSKILSTLLADEVVFQRAVVGVASLTDGLPWVGAADADYLLCLGVFGAAVIVYVVYGGFRAVVWTDVLQGVVMFVGVVVMLVLALQQTGGLEAATRELAEMESAAGASMVHLREGSNVGFLALGTAFSFFVFWAFATGGQPGNLVRLMAFKDTGTLRRAMVTVSVYFSVVYFTLVVVFCCGRVLMPGMDDDPDRIMPALAAQLTAGAGVPWLAGLLLAAPFAAVMSSVDSFLLIVSSSVVRDIYQRRLNPDAPEAKVKRLTYLVTTAVGVLAVLAVLNPPKHLQDLIVFASGGLAGCFLVPMLAALYWRRCNGQGMVWGMVGGFTMHVVLTVAGYLEAGSFKAAAPFGLEPFVWDLIGSALGVMLGSLLTKAPGKELVVKYFG